MSSQTKFDKDDILSNPSLPVVYSKIRGLAKELAVLGKIDTASKITDLLLSQNRTEHGFKQMQFLNFAFEQTGDWPPAVPKSARSKNALDELEISPADPMDEKRYDELISKTELSQRDPPLCLTIAIVLCEKCGKTDVQDIQQDDRVVRAIEQIIEHFHDYIGALIQHRKIWPLLASGVIAQHLGVDDAQLRATAEDVVNTVCIRLKEGRQKVGHEGKPIKELVDILAKNTRKNAGGLYEKSCQDPPKSYLHKPASEKDIKDLEKRLEVSGLPDDYKEFLLISDGLESVYGGHGMIPPLSNIRDVVLSNPTSDVETPLQLVEDSTGTAQLAREVGYDEWPSATKQIEIGRMNESVYVLVDPSDVKATVKAYKKALASNKVSDVVKGETTRAIVDLYGSTEAFEKLEWAMIHTIDGQPVCPLGTFRNWLEETVRLSGKPYDSVSGSHCLAYGCRKKQAHQH